MTERFTAPTGAAARELLASALTLVAVLMLAASAQAATNLHVNTTADTTAPGDCVTPGSTCSLRDAVGVVNATRDDYTITLPAGRYVLTAGELLFSNSGSAHTVVVNGAGARATTVDAGGSSRVFDEGTGNDNLTLSGLTVTGGAATAMR